MNIEYRSFAITPIEGTDTFRAAPVSGGKGNTLAGYAMVYNRDSHLLFDDGVRFIERLDPRALTRSLGAVDSGKLNIHALWSHDESQPLGSTRGGKLKLTSDATGLAFELDTTRFTPAQLDAARDGDLQMSFGMVVRNDAWLIRPDGTKERTILDAHFWEVSPVISPAYPDTTAALRSLEAWKAEESRENINLASSRTCLADTAIRVEGAPQLDAIQSVSGHIVSQQATVDEAETRSDADKHLEQRMFSLREMLLAASR